ncbi:MAG: PfkB family carbohydrate kinase [Nitrospirota bacterium]
MSLLVVGSVALDTVRTPFGDICDGLGGSATYFATAASFFTDVQLVAVVGDDFPDEHIAFLKTRKIDLSGLERAIGKTFRWKGEYGYQLNEARTLTTDLNVFQSFRPKLPASYANTAHLFLANIDPALQLDVMKQVVGRKLTACDTMNFWIEGNPEGLVKTLAGVDILMINEGEARALSGEFNLAKAAQVILALGPKALIVKRGEYGALMFNGKKIFAIPAYPLENVFDPTGAGDSFAGGMMGYIAQNARASGGVSDKVLRQSAIYGSVMASFCVEAFSLDRLKSLTQDDIEKRYKEFEDLTSYEYRQA